MSAEPRPMPIRKGSYAPPVHMIRATETREITSYKWVHSPFDDPHRGGLFMCPKFPSRVSKQNGPVTPGRDECWAPQYFPTIWPWNAVATALRLRML
jgi:hypothetical protein